MLSQAQIDRVWKGMLAAEVRANYFAELVSRLNRTQQYLIWGTLFLSSGAFASVTISDLAILRPFLTLGAAGLSLVSLVQQNQRKAMEAADLHMRWSRIANDLERLWENVYADDGEPRLAILTERISEASKAGTSFPDEPKRMLKWQEHVENHRLTPQHG